MLMKTSFLLVCAVVAACAFSSCEYGRVSSSYGTPHYRTSYYGVPYYRSSFPSNDQPYYGTPYHGSSFSSYGTPYFGTSYYGINRYSSRPYYSSGLYGRRYYSGTASPCRTCVAATPHCYPVGSSAYPCHHRICSPVSVTTWNSRYLSRYPTTWGAPVTVTTQTVSVPHHAHWPH
jgi:hypothetical protein